MNFLRKIYLYILGNEGFLAVKNLNRNGIAITNVTLMTIILAASFLVNSATKSVMESVSDFYADSNFDIQMSTGNADRNLEKRISFISGVADTYGIYEARSENIEVVGKGKSIELLQGIDTSKFFDYYNLNIQGDKKIIAEKLDSGRNILLTNTLKEILGVSIGSKILLNMGTEKQEYNVISFFDSNESYGSYALVSEKYLRTDMKKKYYSRILIKTEKKPQEVKETIIDKLRGQSAVISTIYEMKQNDMKSNEQSFRVMNLFAIIALIIGGIGVFNNFIISFIERKRFMGMLRSVGMSRKQGIKVMLIESFTVGVLGGILGVLGGMLLVLVLPAVIKSYGFTVVIKYSATVLFAFFISSIAIVLVASVGPMLMMAKMNIIQAIKYE